MEIMKFLTCHSVLFEREKTRASQKSIDRHLVYLSEQRLYNICVGAKNEGKVHNKESNEC